MTSEKFKSGSASVTTSAAQISGDTTPLADGVMLRALATNVPDIYIMAFAGLDGYILEPNEEIFVPVKSLSLIYAKATGAGACTISWIAT